MHVLFLGERDDGMSVSSHHARLLAEAGVRVVLPRAAGFSLRDAAQPEDDPQPDIPPIPTEPGTIAHVVTGVQRDFVLLRRLIGARAKGAAIFRYFRPIDALWAEHHPPTRRFGHILQQIGAHQAVGCPRVAERLRRIGISAEPGLIADRHISAAIKPRPMPRRFTVTCHLPTATRRLCGGDVVDQLIEKLPRACFLILGDAATDYADKPNVESLGVVEDINRVLIRTTATIHPVAHDGVSRLALESMCHGRHVVAGFDLPHAHRAQTTDKFLRILRDLCGSARFNLEGREYVCKQFDRATSGAELARRLEACLRETSDGGFLYGKWIATRVKMRNPAVYSRRRFPMPRASDIPEEETAMRRLLDDVARMEMAEASS